MDETFVQAQHMGVKVGDICTAIAGLQNSELDPDQHHSPARPLLSHTRVNELCHRVACVLRRCGLVGKPHQETPVFEEGWY